MKEVELLIVEDSFHYKKGTILKEEISELNDGIEIKKNKHFLSNKSFVRLNESLTSEDERKVKDMIRTQLKYLFWQMYSKQSYMLGNL